MISVRAPREGRQLLIERYGAFAPLSADDEAAFMALDNLQRGPAGSEVVWDHEPLRPRFLIDGWAARVRWLADGRRQIIAFLVPGDALGVCDRPQPLALAPVIALTPVQTVDAGPILARIARGASRPLGDAINIGAAFEEACLIDQVVRLGRQTAYERISHLFLELQMRLRLVRLGTETDFPCPLTQEVIADATGLSIVHVNRTLQQFRRDGLLDLRQGRATLSDAEMLAGICDYRPPQLSPWLASRGH